MKNQITLASSILAVIGCIMMRYAVPFPLDYSISFIPILVGVVLFFLYKSCLPIFIDAWKEKHSNAIREIIVTGVIAFALSSSFVLGAWISCEDSEGLAVMHLIAIIVGALPLFLLLWNFWHWLDTRLCSTTKKSTICTAENMSATNDAAKSLVDQPVVRILFGKGWPLLCFVVLIVCWLPIFLAAYPGFFCYDMTIGDYPEWTQFTERELNNHHPVIHTLFMGTIIRVIADLTGSFTIGVAVFVSLQAVLLAGVFTFLLTFLRNNEAPKMLRVGSLIYLALDPLVSMFVFCTTKDTLFAASAVMLGVLLYNRLTSQKQSEAEQYLAIALTATLFCVLRPNGIIAFIVAAPFFVLLSMRGTRWQMLLTCVVPIVLSLVWLGPVAWALNVEDSELQRINALSIPAQQLTLTYQSDAITTEDREFLEELNYVDRYTHEPPTADATRMNIVDMSTKDLVTAYLTMGVRYPGEYFVAFLQQTQMAWNPYSYIDVYRTRAYKDRSTSLFGFDWESPTSSQSLLPGLLDALGEVAGELTFQNVPLLALLVSVPFYFWFFWLVFARAIIVLDRRALSVCALFGFLMLSAFMGPCTLVRYYLHLFFGLPLLVFMLVNAQSDSNMIPPESLPKVTRA